jgi:peptidoglycan/xylan/chitin deacetylase (PgdA/CDA1 family)
MGGQRDLAAEPTYEYGSRVGFWRLTRLFDARQIPVTIYACAVALERNPPAARAIADRGYDMLPRLALGRYVPAVGGTRASAHSTCRGDPRTHHVAVSF